MAITEQYDVVVIGAGHAGCEAAMAAARDRTAASSKAKVHRMRKASLPSAVPVSAFTRLIAGTNRAEVQLALASSLELAPQAQKMRNELKNWSVWVAGWSLVETTINW